MRSSRALWISLCISIAVQFVMAKKGYAQAINGQTSSGLSTPATRPADELISLSFPPNLELKVLVRYVGDRLGINFIYDDQVVTDHITILSPIKISKDSLMGLLQSALKMKGLIIVDGDQPGWKKILPASNFLIAATTTHPSGMEKQPAAAVMQVFPLSFADPQKADGVIKSFLSQPGGNSVVLAEQHLLIVTDYASTIQRVAELLKLIDQPPQDVAIRFIPVKNVDASVLVSQVQQVISAREKSQEVAAGAASVEILSDPRTNQLILVGPPQKVVAAEPVIAALDIPLPLETRIYTLKTLSPDRLDKLVRELIDPLDAKRLYQSAMDTEAGLLIAITTPEIHKRIAALKDQLDVPANEAASPIRFYKLTNTTAADVLATIRTLEGEDEEEANVSPNSQMATPAPTAGSPQTPAATSTTGYPNSGTGTTSTASTTANALPGLGNSVSGPSGATPPGNGTAQAAPIIGIHTSKGTVTADPNTNTIIVEADPATQRMYEGLIKVLDKRRPQVLIECTLVTIDTSDNFLFGHRSRC